jgi:hypothetical protein
MQVLWTIALPVFGMIFAGYVVGRLRVLGDGSSQALNSAALPGWRSARSALPSASLAMAGCRALATAAEVVVRRRCPIFATALFEWNVVRPRYRWARHFAERPERRAS